MLINRAFAAQVYVYVQDWLLKYGYMGPKNPDHVLQDLYETDEALAYVWGLKLAQTFYRNYNLTATGVLDGATCEMMSWERCDRVDFVRVDDMPDVEGLPHTSRRRRRKRFTASGRQNIRLHLLCIKFR